MKTILVVDDNEINQELLVELLESWGYKVMQATSGPEALGICDSTSPDLVLLDLQMPGMDGYTVVKELQKENRRLACPIVAVTAFAMRGDQEKALACGFDAYLTKPLDFSMLRAQIVSLCGE